MVDIRGAKVWEGGAKVSAKLLLFQPETFALRVTKSDYVEFGSGFAYP